MSDTSEKKGNETQSELVNQVIQDIRDRSVWAEKQAVWYRMRNDGLRRQRKPWPGAADMHFPLIDGTIEKFKPFYLNQVFATERLVDFIGENTAAAQTMTGLAWWFDYKLKQQSNFEKQIAHVFDSVLLNGRSVLKQTWNDKKKRIQFAAIEPLYIIVPSDTDELQDADRIVHVQHMSKWKYKHGEGSENRRQDDDFINRICGGNTTGNDTRTTETWKKLREGITYTENKDRIVVWEIYHKDKDGKVKVLTISPNAPDEPIREEFELPYKHGMYPFVDFTFEVTSSGYYAPRGVAEVLASFEASLCKTWNEKLDAMTLYNRPLFSADREIPNTANLRFQPGAILPFPIRAVDRGSPPISYDMEMTHTRQVAEQRVSVPDFGIGSQNSHGGRKTATEVEALGAVSESVTDMRTRQTRKELGASYTMSWELYKQYDTDMKYLRNKEMHEADKDAMKAVQTVEPNGSSDSWNLQQRLKKSIARMEMFKDSPYVNQGELTKSVIELDEPGLVQKLYIDPMDTQKNQIARIAAAIPALLQGLPVPASPVDDDAIQVDFLLDYLASQAAKGVQLPPEGEQALMARLQEQMQRLEQSNPKVANQLKAKAAQLQRAVAQHQQQQQAAMMQQQMGGMPA